MLTSGDNTKINVIIENDRSVVIVIELQYLF